MSQYEADLINPIYEITAELETATDDIVSEQGDDFHNINERRQEQRKIYNNLLNGVQVSNDYGTSVPVNVPVTSSEVPSWTQYSHGLKHGHVIKVLPITSSYHEVSRWNAYLSGSETVESASLEAAATHEMFYSKKTQLIQVTYKLSASVNNPDYQGATGGPGNPFPAGDGSPYSWYRTGSQDGFHSISGSYSGASGSVWFPQKYKINVPIKGKIRDIKVWVEFIHDYRATGSVEQQGYTGWHDVTFDGLGSTVVALRSPNTSFGYAHPLWNSDVVKNRRYLPTLGGNDENWKIPEIYKNSYILWEGVNVAEDTHGATMASSSLWTTLGHHVTSSNPMYSCWNTDMDMRTKFWDGSTVSNPRHMNRLFSYASGSTPGAGGAITTLTASSPSNTLIRDYLIASHVVQPHVTGWRVPWMCDYRVYAGRCGGIYIDTSQIVAAGVSVTAALPTPSDNTNVPAGWLNGGSSTPDVNEWSTSGYSLGPNDIKPFYPLLDDIYVEKVWDKTAVQNSNSTLPTNHPKIFGFRPGLRGTEVNGEWTLMIGMGNSMVSDPDTILPGAGIGALYFGGFWFRQFRLEFTIDQGEDISSFLPSSKRRYTRAIAAPRNKDDQRVEIISGSSAWDIGVNFVKIKQPDEYGRTLGITDQTGSFPEFAVFTRITGTFADMLTGSAHASARTAYLTNEFNTPYVPISSGSGETMQAQYLLKNSSAIKGIVADVMNPSSAMATTQTMKAVLARSGYSKTTEQLLLEKITSDETAVTTKAASSATTVTQTSGTIIGDGLWVYEEIL